MVSFLQDRGVRFVYCPGYSDYYSDDLGGHDIGRGIEPVPYDGHALGPWLAKLQPGLAKSIGLAVKTNESRDLGHYNRSIGAFTVAARVVLRTAAARVRGQDLLTNGASLIAQLLEIRLLAEGIPVWTEAPVDELVVQDGRAGRGADGARRHAGHGPVPGRASCCPPVVSPTTPRCPEQPVVVEALEDRPREHDSEPAPDSEQPRDQRDPAGDTLARKLVADDPDARGKIAPPMPWMTRAPISTGSVVARAARSVPTARPPSTTTSVRFFPNMSPSRPAIGVATEAERR